MSVLVLMCVVVWRTRAPWPATLWECGHIAVTGVLVHAVYLGGVFIAIGHGLPAGVAAIVVGLQPLLTALGAGWLLREKVRATQWAGLAAGLRALTTFTDCFAGFFFLGMIVGEDNRP